MSLEYIDYVINSLASFGGDKKPEIIARQLFPQKFLANKSFSQKTFYEASLIRDPFKKGRIFNNDLRGAYQHFIIKVRRIHFVFVTIASDYTYILINKSLKINKWTCINIFS